MHVDQIFEAFNHFLATGETREIMAAGTHLECFSSDILGAGNIYSNAEAPAAFRVCILEAAKRGGKFSMEAIGASGSEDTKIYNVIIRQGEKEFMSAISLGMKKDKLNYFIQQNFKKDA